MRHLRVSGSSNECIEKNIEPYDMYNADEAFVTGTPFCILPVCRLNNLEIGDGKFGKISTIVENTPDEKLREWGLDPEIPISHWGWYYPASNYIHVEPVKKSSYNAVMNGICKMIHAYERKDFEAKYYYKTCSHCSYYSICPSAQESEWL